MQNNKKDVYEIQNYIRAIQRADNEENLINPDGIYGAETAEAVMSYQIKKKLPATGRVDTNTWENIYSDYIVAAEILSPAQKVSFFPNNLKALKKGDKRDEVYILQGILRYYQRRNGEKETVEFTGIFDDNTEQVVVEIQKAANVNQTGIVDKLFWNKIVKLHNNRFFSENY